MSETKEDRAARLKAMARHDPIGSFRRIIMGLMPDTCTDYPDGCEDCDEQDRKGCETVKEWAGWIERISTRHPYFECPKCGFRSYNENDIKHRYCGRCHEFHGANEGERR